MELASVLMLAQTLFMLVVSPLGVISPSVLLAGSWAFVFMLQSLLASDMKSSLLATSAIFTITLSFGVGELVGCGGFRLKRNAQARRGPISAIIDDDSDRARRLKTLVIMFGIIGLLGVVAYAYAMGLMEARSLSDLILLPGIGRVQVFSGERVIPLYGKVCLLFTYPGAVLALTYYYLYRWRWWLLLPMFAVLLFGMSESGRMGTLMVIVQAALSIYMKNVIVLKRNVRKSLLAGIVVPAALILTVFVGMEFLREGFRSTGIEGVVRVMFTARAYLFGGLSAFSYWINSIYEPGRATLGGYSFSSLFNVLGIAKQKVGVYDFYAPISSNYEVSNVYTAYRSFIEDFTLAGACLFYFVAGVFIASITRRITKEKKSLISIVIPLLSWLALSPMISVTYFNSFLVSCVLPYFIVSRTSRAEKCAKSV
jgi:oligosaccharide repeat unit polymerase